MNNSRNKHALPIPTHKLEWVLGIEQIYLKELTDKTGAIITIDGKGGNEFGREWSYLIVEGTEMQVDQAQKLLFIRMELYNEYHTAKLEEETEDLPR